MNVDDNLKFEISSPWIFLIFCLNVLFASFIERLRDVLYSERS